jgi:hypothetical protein
MMNWYQGLLVLHSWNRWLVLATAAGALAALARGGLRRRPFGRGERGAVLLFLGAFDTQVLLGLLLYFVFSPWGLPRDVALSVVMHDAVRRYFAVEHLSGMLAALAVAHAAWVWAKRGRPEARRRRAGWAVALPLLMVLVTLPWPGLPYGRDLLRLSSSGSSLGLRRARASPSPGR